MNKGIICGRGGQGIITVNRMLGEIAARLGLGSLSAETHGMAMRGGSVATFIKIGQHYSPSIGIGEADFMIATDCTEAKRNVTFCAENALCIIDSAQPVSFPGLRVFTLDASLIASREYGSVVAAGSILLGAFLAHNESIYERALVLSLVHDFFPKAVPALERGYTEAKHAHL